MLAYSLFLVSVAHSPFSFAWYALLSARTASDGFRSEYLSCNNTVFAQNFALSQHWLARSKQSESNVRIRKILRSRTHASGAGLKPCTREYSGHTAQDPAAPLLKVCRQAAAHRRQHVTPEHMSIRQLSSVHILMLRTLATAPLAADYELINEASDHM